MHTGGRRLPMPSLVTLAVAALMLSCYLAPFADLDFTWQIRTGEQILRTGQLRTADEFTYTINGQPVHDFEWLYEVLLYLTWSALGVGGLKLLKVVIVMVPLGIVAMHLRRRQVPGIGIALALVVAVIILSPAWNLRAFYCTTIGLLALATWLHDHCAGRRPLDWRLPLLMLLWAHLHPGVIAGQALLLTAMTWEGLNFRLRVNTPLDRSALRKLFLFGGLALLATFVSPDPVDRLLYPFRPELRHPIHRTFAEMLPLSSFVTQAPVVVLGTYLVAAVVALSVILRFRQYRLWEIMLLVVSGLLANLAVRGVQDWVLLMLALGVPHLAALARHLSRNELAPAAPIVIPPAADLAWSLRFQPGWMVAMFAALALVTLARPFSDAIPVAANCPCPRGAVAYIRDKGLQGRFFAPPNYGAYLGWSLGPQGLVYVDTRGFFFPPQLLEDSHVLPQLGPDWVQRLDRVLNEYGTDYLLLETTGPRGALWQHLQVKNAEPLFLDAETVLLSAAQVRPLLPSATADAKR